MRRSNGARGRHHQAQHYDPNAYAAPPAYQSAPPPPRGYAPPPLPPSGGAAPPSRAALERDVAAFVNALRSSRSDPASPPNALNMRDALQAICAQFGVATYEELLGTPPHQLPALRQLQIQHERVWSFVTCYMHARRIHTLHECHIAFLQQEGLRHFAELGIGNSFLHTDAVQTLYHAPATIYPLTTKDVLTAFRQFESVLGHDAFAERGDRGGYHRPPQRIDRDQFKQFISQQRRQPSAEAMGLHIDADGFGPYIAMLRRVSKKEQREIQELQDEFNKGIADRVFELSKQKFSAENRQQALDELMQRTSDAREKEQDRVAPRLSAKRATATLSSLSLEILNRVTDVDVYLDNVLRWKSADERFKGRIAAHQIADTDQKIRTQLTQFLLASQKSRHHARVKVVTWVLCGVLAKIHALLQLDDKLPDADKAAELKKLEALEDGSKKTRRAEEDEDEECECCCVGLDSCRCQCDCECHRDASDDESIAATKSPATESVQTTADQQPSSATEEPSPAKRKRSRSRSDSVTAATPEEIRSTLAEFFSSQSSDGSLSAQDALRRLAEAEALLRSTYGARLGQFSLLEQVVKAGDDDESGGDGVVPQSLLRALGQRSGGEGRFPSAHEEEDVRSFFAACLASSPEEQSESFQRRAIQLACTQFDLDYTDASTRDWLAKMLRSPSPPLPSVTTATSIHYAAALAVHQADGGEGGADDPDLVSAKTAEALQAVAACPPLVDVAAWTQWSTRFAPVLGPLRVFLRSHEMNRAFTREDHAGLLWTSTAPRLVRVRSDASASSLDAAGLSAADLAEILVSLCVQHQPSGSFPRALVVLHLKTALQRVEKEESGIARLVLDTLLAVPRELAGMVFALLQDAAKPRGLVEMLVAEGRATPSLLEAKQLAVLAQWIPPLSAVVSSPPPRSVTPATVSTIVPVQPPSLITDAPQQEEEEEEAEEEEEEQREEAPLVPSSASDCEAFVMQLRREQFGVGLAIDDAATRAVLHVQHRRLERALQRLSDELYSEKTHFVLELLQNADDNQYPRGVVPSGAFTLTADGGAIVFANNERGFSSANVAAICDVGASTKKKEQHQIIGHKGIGFKSVFKVSDSPEVHSNGFHLRFHVHAGGSIGYILPHWISDPREWRGGGGGGGGAEGGTTLVLPLNAASASRREDIASSLLALEPSVLLFLRRIRVLRLENEATATTLALFKEETKLGGRGEDGCTVSLATLRSERASGGASTATVVKQWVVVRKSLATPSIFHTVRGGSSTEIAIALPICGETEEEEATARPPLQDVFCYLPLRSYGLRFIVQGDFDVPSSREAIATGSEWNEWLISQFAALFPALIASHRLELAQLMRLLPLESDVQPPFRSVVAAISRQVRQLACFPTASGDLVAATELLDTSDVAQEEDGNDLAILERNNDEIVVKALGKRVMDLSLARATPAMVKAQLRIEKLRASHVLRLLSYAAASATEDRLQLVVKLLHLLARLWRHERHRPLLLQELRRIKCFPLQTGEWTSVDEAVLFLRSVHTPSTRGELVEGDLRTLHDDFALALDALADTRRFLLEQVGVKELKDHDLMLHHVLPAMAAKDLAPANWRELVRFLAGHFAGSCTAATCPLASTVGDAMRVLTWTGRLVGVASEPQVLVVLPQEAAQLSGLCGWLRTRLVDTATTFDVVTLDGVDGVDDGALRTLFVDVCGRALLLDTSDRRVDDALAAVVEWIHKEPDAGIKRRVSSELATFVAATWPASVDTAPSGAWWQRAPWLEASDGRYYRPQDLWTVSRAVDALFSRAMVPIAAVAFESVSLRLAWGLKSEPSVDDVITVLKTHSASTHLHQGVDATEWTRVYTFLLDQSRQDTDPTTASTIRSAFESAALIFIPASEEEDEEGTGSGRFVRVDDVVWTSGRSSVATTSPLDEIYPKTLRAFFVSVCGVERKPTVAMLAHALSTALRSGGIVSEPQWQAQVGPILCRLAKLLRSGKVASSDTKILNKTLKKTAWIPVAGEFQLVSVQSSKCLAYGYQDDDASREIQRLWTALSGGVDEPLAVQVVGGPDELEDLEPLLRLVGVVSISDSVRESPASWCQSLAAVAASATGHRKAMKKYEKLLKTVLPLWADTDSHAVTTELSLLPLFPSSTGQLHRGVDLFLNDQSVLSREQLSTASLATLGLYPSSFFVDGSDEAARVQRLLTEQAQVKSLAQHLHTELVLLGPTRDADDYADHQLHRVLAIAQRVVFHHHSSVHDRLDHSTLRVLLPQIQTVHVEGVLQLLHRVATTAMTLRESVSCHLDRKAHKLYVATSDGNPHASLFDLLLEISRQCFGSAIATSVANVLFLASMQPTDDALEAWLVNTQQLLPLDARCTAEMRWFTDDTTTAAARSKRVRETAADADEPEDGEVEDDAQPQPKRTKHATWDGGVPTATQAYPGVSTPSAYPAASSSAPQYGGGYRGSAYTSSMRSLPIVPGVNTLSDEEKLAIGRWGEEYVYQQLKQSYAERADVAVDWVNEVEESGLPYDIVVKTGTSNDVEYVEVKATRTMEKGVFEISMNELDQAATHGSRYSIYRVFNAGNPAMCRVVRMKNPIALVRQRKIQLVLMMQ